MAKARSPSYPAIGLKEAIEKARAIYDEDYQNPIPRSVAAEHMGYQSLNGKSLGVLSALLKYGLLEGRGDQTRVSDLAVTIIAHPAGAPERVEALQAAALRPELFAELDSRFKGGRASDQALRSFLLTQRFIPSAADAVIRSYRETKQLVDAESAGYDSETEAEELEEATMSEQSPPAGQRQQQARSEPPAMPLSEDDPYQLTLRPRGGLELHGRLRSEQEVDDLIAALRAWKGLLKPADEIRKPEASAGDDDTPEFLK